MWPVGFRCPWNVKIFPDQGLNPYSLRWLADSSSLYHQGSPDLWVYLSETTGTVGRRQWQPTPVVLPGKSHGWRNLVVYSPWGRKELDMTEQLHFHFSLSCTGEGNGSPLQCFCLENPRDGEPDGLPSMGSHSQTRLT